MSYPPLPTMNTNWMDPTTAFQGHLTSLLWATVIWVLSQLVMPFDFFITWAITASMVGAMSTFEVAHNKNEWLTPKTSFYFAGINIIPSGAAIWFSSPGPFLVSFLIFLEMIIGLLVLYAQYKHSYEPGEGILES